MWLSAGSTSTERQGNRTNPAGPIRWFPKTQASRIGPERDSAVPGNIDHGAIPAARDGGDLESANSRDCDEIDPVFRESEEPGRCRPGIDPNRRGFVETG